MARAASASLEVGVVAFTFDPDPGTASSRALRVLAPRKALPRAEVGAREALEAAARRALKLAGAEPAARRGAREPLWLLLVDSPASRATRSLTVWYYAIVPFHPEMPGDWMPALARSGRVVAAADDAVFRAAVERVRSDARHISGAAALLGDVLTGDDLLRVHTALHGGPEGSERTFRRRIQELRDDGVLRPVRESEVAALRLREPRFRSPAGTGGRPPELLRYSGTGHEEEQVASLRARRSA